MAAPQDAEIHLCNGNGSGNSLAGSGDSSPPPSRSGDADNPWEEAAAPPAPSRRGPPAHPPAGQRVKFMCSYGGRIQPRAHDHRLAYIGGETKIVGVDRSVRFLQLFARLAALPPPGLFGPGDFCVKYQLPGEDLDALISITNEEDVENMMFEYDRLLQRSSHCKPARLRLFLFHSAAGFPSHVRAPDRRLFANFLESMQSPATSPAELAAELVSPAVSAGISDFRFDLGPPLRKTAISESGPTATARESIPCKNRGECPRLACAEQPFLKKPDNIQIPAANSNSKQGPAATQNGLAASPEAPLQRAPKAGDEVVISAGIESHATQSGHIVQGTAHQTTIPLARMQDSGVAERTAVCASSMTAMYVIPSPAPHGLFSGIPTSQGFYTAVAPSMSPLQPQYPLRLNQGQADCNGTSNGAPSARLNPKQAECNGAANGALPMRLNQGHAESNGTANGAGPSQLLAAYDGAGRPLYYVTHGAPQPSVSAAAISAYQTTAAGGGDEQGRLTAAQPGATGPATAAQILSPEVMNGLKPA